MDFDQCKDPIQERLEESLPWIGLYIAAASTICTLAMAADAINAFRRKKLWFPCKFFSLDATSLTLLGVAMKLPMDLTTIMVYSSVDLLAKLSGTVFMSTAMANFMSSLGSMTDKEILATVVALGILVITVVVDVVIQLITLWDIFISHFFLISLSMMLLLLATLVSLAITVPTMKRSLESLYREKYKVALGEEEFLERPKNFRINDKRGHNMMKYWVMAETSSPQFVMARSVVSTSSALICLLVVITLASAYIQSLLVDDVVYTASSYKESTKWILYIQITGIAVGTIAPMLRWFVVVSFNCSTTNKNGFKKRIKVENYWTQNLVDWRDSFSGLHVRQGKYRKCLHNMKWFAFTFCIRLQSLIVVLSKLFVFLSVLFMSPIFSCFAHIKRFVKSTRHEAGGDDKHLDYLRNFVLLLDDEPELPTRVLRNMYFEANEVIQTGKRKQPKNLLDLLHKFDDFNGVGKFDQIPSRYSHEPPDSWMLPVVTLASIAIALPNVGERECKRLLSSVSEGLSLAKLVEKTLVKNAELVNIKKAADICWVGVILYMNWLDVNLRKMSINRKNAKTVLQDLSNEAEKKVMEFKTEAKIEVMGDPVNWPANVVAANSMFRISQTILLSCEVENERTDEGLFERLCVMIADILAACLTNLPHVVTTMCRSSAIETREKSVREAFLLLGKTKQIVEFLEKRERPPLYHDKAASIEEWRAFFRQKKDEPAILASTSSDYETVIAAMFSSEEHLAVKVDS